MLENKTKNVTVQWNFHEFLSILQSDAKTVIIVARVDVEVHMQWILKWNKCSDSIPTNFTISSVNGKRRLTTGETLENWDGSWLKTNKSVKKITFI